MIDDSTQHIARISYGKDSLKMLDVIWTRGIPLDRITTTDVWATDTISANLPPMDAFKARMDQWIWDRYRIEVEHLCAVNPDGSKRTYEQMFYHVPKRRSQDVQVERERERGETGSRASESHGVRVHSRRVLASGAIRGYPDLWNPWCQADLKRVSTPPWRIAGTVTGFPPNTGYNWCQKLKIDKVRTPFWMGGTRLARRKQKSWSTSASRRMSRNGSDS